jgi:hypothetical protein
MLTRREREVIPAVECYLPNIADGSELGATGAATIQTDFLASTHGLPKQMSVVVAAKRATSRRKDCDNKR